MVPTTWLKRVAIGDTFLQKYTMNALWKSRNLSGPSRDHNGTTNGSSRTPQVPAVLESVPKGMPNWVSIYVDDNYNNKSNNNKRLLWVLKRIECLYKYNMKCISINKYQLSSIQKYRFIKTLSTLPFVLVCASCLPCQESYFIGPICLWVMLLMLMLS